MKFFKPDKNFLGLLLVFFVIVSGIGNFHAVRLYDSQADILLERELQATAKELNSFLASVEQTADVISCAAVMTLHNPHDFFDEDVRNFYIDGISDYLVKTCKENKYVYSVYLHLSPEVCGLGNVGTYLIFDENNDISYGPVVNLAAYSRTDYENVGWYYIPVDQNRRCWIEPYHSVTEGSYIISYVIPLFIDGQSFGVFRMDVKMTSLIDFVGNRRIFGDGFMYLTDRSSSILGKIPRIDADKDYISVEQKLINNMELVACVPSSSLYKITSDTTINILMILRACVIVLIIFCIILQIEFFVNRKRRKQKRMPIRKLQFAYGAIVIGLVALQCGYCAVRCSRENYRPDQTPVKADNSYEKTVTVCGDMEFAPFSFIENGKIVGHDVDVITEICNRLGYNVKVDLINWNDAISQTLEGKYDIILGLSSIPSDEDVELLRSNPFFDDYFVVIGKHPIDSILETTGKQNATLRGLTQYDIYGVESNAVYFNTYEEVIQAVEDGVCEFGVIRESVANVLKEQYGYDDIMIVYTSIESYLCMGVAPQNAALLAQINSAINEMIMDGTLTVLGNKWVYSCTESKSVGEIIRESNTFFILSTCGAMLLILLMVITKIQQQKKQIEEQGRTYKELSETDSLTGIYNRGHGEDLVRKCLKNDIEGVYCFFDVDKFKFINDTYGHAVGDKVLCSVGGLLKSFFRSGDIVYRVGGDEFAMYLPGLVDIDVLNRKMTEFMGLVDEINIDELNGYRVSISAGLAFYEAGSYLEFDELYRRADGQAYISKKTSGSYFSVLI